MHRISINIIGTHVCPAEGSLQGQMYQSAEAEPMLPSRRVTVIKREFESEQGDN